MSERVTVRWWRWRRNALKRRIDVVEAWVVLVGWVFALLGGLRRAGPVTGPRGGRPPGVGQGAVDRAGRLDAHGRGAGAAQDSGREHDPRLGEQER
jgi:hypothetical protein